MERYKSPLSVYFIWHPKDEKQVSTVVEHCLTLLSYDVTKPFSRAMNLPVFFRTSINGTPQDITTISRKTIAFIFISKELISNKEWIEYIEKIHENKEIHSIVICLDRVSLNLSSTENFKNENFIRAYEFDGQYINDLLFIAVSHEIFRYALNETYSEMQLGTNSAIKLFLSHEKDNRIGLKLAFDLKNFIDNSTMNNFFDASDISAGYKFDNEIIGHIKESTIIAIHSDQYSSRYWCQREIISAKEFDRPIVDVDIIEEFEDRRFPFASNIPCIRINSVSDKGDILRILSFALLETIRFYYSKLILEQYKIIGWIDQKTLLRSRPPEISDVERLFEYDGTYIKYKTDSLVYPEPPVYSEELHFLSKLGIKANTPLTLEFCNLKGLNIGISISDITENELIEIGQSNKTMIKLSQDIARHLLSHGAILVYGGDLRDNGFTQFLFNEALSLKSRIHSQNIHINNYIAWPIYLKDTDKTKNWKSSNLSIANMIELPLPGDVKDLLSNQEVYISPTDTNNRYIWSRSLTEMRRQMIEECNVRICVGGKSRGYKGLMPGILEETIYALEKKTPVFLLGGFGGITSSICKLLQNEIPQELTLNWQIENNEGYEDLLHFYESRGLPYETIYSSLLARANKIELNNGLCIDDNILLFNTPFIDEAVHLIIKGLKSLYGN